MVKVYLVCAENLQTTPGVTVTMESWKNLLINIHTLLVDNTHYHTLAVLLRYQLERTGNV